MEFWVCVTSVYVYMVNLDNSCICMYKCIACGRVDVRKYRVVVKTGGLFVYLYLKMDMNADAN